MSKVGAMGSSSFSSSASAGVTTPEDVLKFWFKGVGPETGYMRKEWFQGGPEFDGKCEEKFGESLKLFSTGALDGWMKTVRGRLALVILLDQIFRNVHRNSALSYSQDPAAIKITLDTIEQGWDKELTPSERHFLYMPLMHSESLRDHEVIDHLLEDLATENSDNEKLHEQLIAVLEFERKHSAVLKTFGRYPSRNAVLGRPNTKEEEEFLASGGGWETTSQQPPGKVETPAGTRSGEESASAGPTRTEPAQVDYVENAKSEMKRIEDIQKVLKQVEDLQENLAAANVKDKLAPVVEDLQKKLAVRKEKFQKYRSRIDKDVNFEK